MSVTNGYCSAEILDEAMYDHFQPKYAQQEYFLELPWR